MKLSARLGLITCSLGSLSLLIAGALIFNDICRECPAIAFLVVGVVLCVVGALFMD